ncbi:sodium-coupled monocarboxylate transporter 1 isoform X2 [Lingula anatina]|uniref:Sodium-coupled monocarboxylate transporter 1 isoform X2 n=1 Tax=Lingula anatina TaxID=7574 RepID=A0A2R2MRX8_LINAN|nr:sodium-coupled monocarboxylate transporter 1 isoform X2 [Lingula anatina]|eukprot:XP_023933015.1 sodium-coupled monocarboxylate transporter 1 isoform X2 [Lingula anatina]
MTPTDNKFHWADYVILVAVLVASAATGIYYSLSGGKQKTNHEFLTADRKLKVAPVAVSLLVSLCSAISILGASAEMYYQGTQYYLFTYSLGLAAIVASVTFVPLLYPLRLTSVNEYLELRYKSKSVRILGFVILLIYTVLIMSVAIYAPATALEAVTGLPLWATILSVGLVSTFYTALGGIKAVVWADVLQSLVMIGGILAIIIQGSLKVGGLEEVWNINDEGGRLDFFDFNPDPTKRHTFWAIIVGGTLQLVAFYGVNQASTQRYCNVETGAKAKLVMILNPPLWFIMYSLICLAGVVVYAYYASINCDPLKAKYIKNANQIIPYFLMDQLSYPGVPGLFIACILSGALSTVSSAQSALAAVTWEDVFKPKLNHIAERKKTWISKGLVIFFGALCIGFAFLTSQLGGTVMQLGLSFQGAANGPLLGMFLLGALVPFANWLGVLIGGILGLAFPLWISFGAYLHKPPTNYLPTNISGCLSDRNASMVSSAVDLLVTNLTTVPSVLASDSPAQDRESGFDLTRLYTVSYMWYGAVGLITTLVFGTVISLITGPMKREDIDDRLLFSWCCCCRKSETMSSCIRKRKKMSFKRVTRKKMESTTWPSARIKKTKLNTSDPRSRGKRGTGEEFLELQECLIIA